MQPTTEQFDIIANLHRKLEEKDDQIKQLQRENDKLKIGPVYSGIDELTGLLSRRSFQNQFKEIKNTHDNQEKLSLILIDIDHFKVINDRYGHDVADGFLQEFAQLLKETASTADLLGRVGGEEFCVMIQKPASIAYDLAELIRSQTETTIWKKLDKPITISLGVAEIKSGQTYEELLVATDRCLYAAKSEGRNCVIAEVDLSVTTEEENEDLIIVDLENRIRVVTERLTQYMIIRAKRMANHFKQEAALDGLTGVYNRGYLDRLLGREIDKSKKLQSALTVIMIDIDNFGKVNKYYNWTAGDLAVKTIASVIQQQVRVNDWVARYGGDEFIAVMPDTKKAEGSQIAERIREVIEKTHMKANNNVEFQVTTSIGVIESMGSESLQMIYELVGTAARKAKINGKNKVV